MSRLKPDNNLELGSNVIDLMLPFKRPLALVDGIFSYHAEPQPRIRGCRHISANEPIFEGHFKDLHIWPGIYTQEGLGQTGTMLKVIHGLQNGWREAGRDPEGILVALRNLELGYKLHPGFKPEVSAQLLQALPQAQRFVEMTGSVEMKFLRPVFAGQRLDYDVTLVKEFDNMLRFEAEASVGGEPVARGNITASVSKLRPAQLHER